MQGYRNFSLFLTVVVIVLVFSFPRIYAQTFVTDLSDPPPKKLWTALVQSGIVFSAPMGNGYTNFSSGVGFETSLFLALNHNLALGISLGKSGLRKNEDKLLERLPGFIIKDDLSLSLFTYSALFAYYRYFNRGLPAKGMTYSYIGLGLASHSSSGQMWIQSGSDLYVVTYEGGSTRFSIPLGVGFQFGLSRGVGLILSARYTFVSLPKNQQESFKIFENSTFDIKAGLSLYIPTLGRY